ncbi:uncharacterized protein DC041_0009955 [Schistosoma bovis]|uniref:Uncharacterized protein n=1 Tax=Schistosoma bovis TaxID=6184 RepID=A0A430Q825_SCHBO|nr:uncharacterized protein DC041_0009955 [Schistosoma bovis]
MYSRDIRFDRNHGIYVLFSGAWFPIIVTVTKGRKIMEQILYSAFVFNVWRGFRRTNYLYFILDFYLWHGSCILNII